MSQVLIQQSLCPYVIGKIIVIIWYVDVAFKRSGW